MVVNINTSVSVSIETTLLYSYTGLGSELNNIISIIDLVCQSFKGIYVLKSYKNGAPDAKGCSGISRTQCV